MLSTYSLPSLHINLTFHAYIVSDHVLPDPSVGMTVDIWHQNMLYMVSSQSSQMCTAMEC